MADMMFAGIDPGKNGALAIIFSSGEAVVFTLYDEAVLPMLKQLSTRPHRLCLEQVHAMPQQGVSSTFTFGMNYGWIKGVLDAYHISYQEVVPRKWKAEYQLNNDKHKSVEVCRKLFPEADLKPTARSKVDDNNMAEALLMAEYARRKL